MRDSSQPTAPIKTEPSSRSSAGRSARLGVRLARVGMMAALLALGGGLAGGCSDNLDCKPIMQQGAVYKATILAETATSDACHIVTATRMSPFSVTVGKTEPTADRPDCSVTPAAAPPEQIDVQILSCEPAETDMLGVYCKILYKAGCDGHMLFSFAAPENTAVNWSAPVIEGVLFRIADFSPNCFADKSNCLDVYTAKLERQP